MNSSRPTTISAPTWNNLTEIVSTVMANLGEGFRARHVRYGHGGNGWPTVQFALERVTRH